MELDIHSAVGCFIHYKDKILILRRSKHETVPGIWGIPGGVIDDGETPIDAISREVEEEIGIKFPRESFKKIGGWLWKLPKVHVTYYAFRLDLEELPGITLDPMEHDEYMWLLPEEYFAMKDIMPGNHELLQRAGYVSRDKPYVESHDI